MTFLKLSFAAVLVFAAASCALSDDDRCSEHQEYLDGACVCEEGYRLAQDKIECVPVEDDESTDTDSAVEDSGDLGGLGDPCTPAGGECEENAVASTCGSNPLTGQGKCTIAGCAVNPDDCPEGWTCCDFDELGDRFFGGENLCLDKEMLDEIAGYQIKCL